MLKLTYEKVSFPGAISYYTGMIERKDILEDFGDLLKYEISEQTRP